MADVIRIHGEDQKAVEDLLRLDWDEWKEKYEEYETKENTWAF